MVIRNVPDKAPPASGEAAESPATSAPTTLPARIMAVLQRGARAISAPLRVPRQRGAGPAGHPAGMHRYKFQAFVAVIPGRDQTAGALPGPDWHGVLRAGSTTGLSHGVFSALVTDWDQFDSGTAGGAGEPHAMATIVAFGPDPEEALPDGGIFSLWCGRDVGLGIVTRRAFV